jgi:hypothetical protein
MQNYCTDYTANGYTAHSQSVVTLSDLYSTGELIGGVVGDVIGRPYPTEWNGGSAFLTLSGLPCPEREASAGKMKYRLKFQSETNTTYKVTWEEVTLYADGTSETAILSEVVEGNGSVVSIPANMKSCRPENRDPSPFSSVPTAALRFFLRPAATAAEAGRAAAVPVA